MLTTLALFPLVLLFVGFGARRQRGRHVAVMTVAILADFAVVAAVEYNRHVIAKASGPLSPLLKFHISLAATSLLLYPVSAATGAMLWWGKGGRRVHKTVGVLLLVVRSLTSATSYFVVGP